MSRSSVKATFRCFSGCQGFPTDIFKVRHHRAAPIMLRSLLFLTILFSVAYARVGYNDLIPNGYKVPCPTDSIGCDTFCIALGHNTTDAATGKVVQECSSNNTVVEARSSGINAFGRLYVTTGWNSDWCKKDGDGDGLYDGQELARTYHVRMRGCNSLGCGTYSSWLTFSTSVTGAAALMAPPIIIIASIIFLFFEKCRSDLGAIETMVTGWSSFLHKRSLLLLSILYSVAYARVGYNDLIPNGYKVPCPTDSIGCDTFCIALGHNTTDATTGKVVQECSSNNTVVSARSSGINAFGRLYVTNGWNSDWCKKDGDGDGLYDGQELGDYLCLWTVNNDIAVPSTHLSHPGDATAFDAAVLNKGCYKNPNYPSVIGGYIIKDMLFHTEIIRLILIPRSVKHLFSSTVALTLEKADSIGCDTFCIALGHNTTDATTGKVVQECSSNNTVVAARSSGINAFGRLYVTTGWNSDWCKKDGDGDGLYDGQELGDYLCLWTVNNDIAVPSTHLSHPGDATAYDPAVLNKGCYKNPNYPSVIGTPPNVPKVSVNSTLLTIALPGPTEVCAYNFIINYHYTVTNSTSSTDSNGSYTVTGRSSTQTVTSYNNIQYAIPNLPLQTLIYFSLVASNDWGQSISYNSSFNTPTASSLPSTTYTFTSSQLTSPTSVPGAASLMAPSLLITSAIFILFKIHWIQRKLSKEVTWPPRRRRTVISPAQRATLEDAFRRNPYLMHTRDNSWRSLFTSQQETSKCGFKIGE
ncbi:hypothetical protein PROFUN_01554 [Planoprotostelium fungivorum]|uniref:Temptin Cys/Cys disulfide domain-containing protein n=1 Tax=Planoprotostelium fungivorum TaxID=1890364 RepID=A0A2P6NTJ9_9EUKA|nr:hypothetical protein PROFUN_01554 [Planoprotostelium fungivorum]